MRSISTRLGKLEQALPAKRREWYHAAPILADFAIHLESSGISLSNSEFCKLAGLAWPITLPGDEIERRLISLAMGYEMPDELQTAKDHLIYWFTWRGIRYRIRELVEMAGPDEKRELTRWLVEDGYESITMSAGAYPDFLLSAEVYKRFGSSEFIHGWLARIERRLC